MIEKQNDDFDKADVNKDCLLNKEEFFEFCKLNEESKI